MTIQTAVVNPLLDYGPDPWALCHGGYFYYTHSTSDSLTIWKVKSFADLAHTAGKVVWQAPESGPYSSNVWAPELHYLDRGDGHKCWYAYLSASNETTLDSQHVWVLENDACDPVDGQWTVKGQVVTPADKWSIDGTVVDLNGALYFAWSGWENDENNQQNIYLCRMRNPWTCVGERLLVSAPTLPWEQHNYDAIDPGNIRNRLLVNEAPAFLHHGDYLFIAYSASGCWTDQYAFGLLHARTDSDLMDPASWTKSQGPVFTTSPETDTYGPGHGCFFQTDAGQTWLLYHANPQPNLGCENERTPRLQPIMWRPDGMPDFGVPQKEVMLDMGH